MRAMTEVTKGSDYTVTCARVTPITRSSVISVIDLEETAEDSHLFES